MTHLTSDQIVDALDGVLETNRKHHLGECPWCQQQLADLRGVLDETRVVEMPEPSPLYWQHLSDRVRAEIAAEPLAAGGWRNWLRWPVLAPIAVLASLVMTLAVTVPRPAAVAPNLAVSAAAETSMDEGWVVVADLVGDLDWDTAMSVGLTVEPGVADQAVLKLSATEQQALTRLLQAELTRAKS